MRRSLRQASAEGLDLALDASRVHVHGVERGRGADEQTAMVMAAEAKVAAVSGRTTRPMTSPLGASTATPLKSGSGAQPPALQILPASSQRISSASPPLVSLKSRKTEAARFARCASACRRASPRATTTVSSFSAFGRRWHVRHTDAGKEDPRRRSSTPSRRHGGRAKRCQSVAVLPSYWSAVAVHDTTATIAVPRHPDPPPPAATIDRDDVGIRERLRLERRQPKAHGSMRWHGHGKRRKKAHDGRDGWRANFPRRRLRRRNERKPRRNIPFASCASWKQPIDVPWRVRSTRPTRGHDRNSLSSRIG